MTSYLVTKRLKDQDGQHFPGDVLVDPDGAAILMERGLISPVPDDYKPPAAAAAKPKAEKPKDKTTKSSVGASDE